MRIASTLSPIRRPPVVALAALLAALLGACGGGGSTQPAPPPLASAALVPAQPGELTTYLRDRVRQRLGSGSPLATGPADGPPAGLAAAAEDSASTTWIQEPGIDEDDLLKSHGNEVYSLNGAVVRHDRLTGPGVVSRLQALTLEPEGGNAVTQFTGLYLSDAADAGVALGQSWEVGGWQGDCGSVVCPTLSLIAVVPTVPRVLIQPLRTGPSLSAGDRIVIDGRWVGSRRLGNQLIVVSTHEPALAVDALPASATAAEREAALAALRASDLLPRLRIGQGPALPLVAEADCYLQPGNGSPAVEITTVTVFDLASPTLAHRSRCFVGGSEALYMAADAIYLATTRWPVASPGAPLVYPTSFQTDVHRFVLDGASVSYRASGTVDGHLGWDAERKPSRFSAWNGHVRVLTFTGSVGWSTAADATGTPPSPATLTVLAVESGQLREVARLPNAQHPEPLGKPGEQVFAVRFEEDRGYVVTFRQVDPLYVLDLATASDPRTAGVLEVPGFSQDLFPVGSGWLLGVGRDADANGVVGGIKLALFDVRDATRPLLQDSRVLGGIGSTTALDFSRHGLNLGWRDGVARAALPVALSVDGGWQQGLQRIEVDPAAGTIQLAPLIERQPALPWPDVSVDRSLQIGDQLIWLSQDLVGAWAW